MLLNEILAFDILFPIRQFLDINDCNVVFLNIIRRFLERFVIDVFILVINQSPVFIYLRV